MKSLIFALLTGIGAAAAASSAGALPVAKQADGVHATVQKADYRDHHRMLRRRDRFNWDDTRYSQYRGWHHYNSRPWHWHERNCVAVGPIWFCP